MIGKHVTATYRCFKSSSLQSIDLFTNRMASILRRTLSPAYHDRAAYQNVVAPFSVSSPSHKHFSIANGNFGKHSYPFSSLLFSKLIKTPSFRKFFARCALFFLLGFLFAISPFSSSSNQDDITSRRSSFEINTLPPPSIRIEEKTVVSSDDASPAAVTIGSSRKQLILITATYNRALQYYYLSRLSQTVRLVGQPVLWIVVEMDTWTTETAELLRKSRVMYRHLVCKRTTRNGVEDFKDRGVRQRNVALEHIERHKLEGIVYFADDDNIYSLEMFEQLRDISRFGTWPVAMLAASKRQAILEGPVCNASLVIGWHTNEKSKRLRRFHVDMSGFAFNSTILWDPKTWGRPTSTPIRQLDSVKEGFQETTFIEQVVEDESQMEGTPSGCSRVMNWHLHLDAHDLVYPKGWVLPKNLDAVLPLIEGS